MRRAVLETRVHFAPVEEPPAGWRSGAHWLDEETGDLARLWTSAPLDESPFAPGYEHAFIHERRVVQVREVCEWHDYSG